MAWPLIPVLIDIATDEDAGAWADAIANSPRLKASDYIPAAPFQTAQDGREGGFATSPALPANTVSASPHANPSSAEAQHDLA